MFTTVPNDIFWNRIALLLAAAFGSAVSLWLFGSPPVEPTEFAAALSFTSNVLDLACAGGGFGLPDCPALQHATGTSLSVRTQTRLTPDTFCSGDTT